MEANEILIDVFGRVAEHVSNAVEGLDAEQLAAPPVAGSNPIGWLIWHLTRVEDAHIAELLEEEQLWVTGSYAARIGVEPDPTNSGYGHSPEDVAAIRPDGPEVLLEYYGDVSEPDPQLPRRSRSVRLRAHRRRQLGPAGDPRRAARQHRRRRGAARWTGQLRQGHPARLLIDHRPSTATVGCKSGRAFGDCTSTRARGAQL